MAAALVAASALPAVLGLGVQSASASPLPAKGQAAAGSPQPGIAANGYGTTFTPTVAKDNTVIVVAIGADHKLYENDLRPNQSWNIGMDLGGSNLDNNPAAVTDNNGMVRIYAHGMNGRLYEKTVVPGRPWSVMWSLGGSFPA
ncbi:hypothetical protein [Kitasatospora griseola]|uniref:hypothetical protein n=1 Tax=Kitasatospora griseola TaxID=2064 RepID=UPI0037F60108